MATERSHPGSAPVITTKPLTIHVLTLQKLPPEKRRQPRSAQCLEYFLLTKRGVLEGGCNTYIECMFNKYPDRSLFCSARSDSTAAGDFH